MFLDESGHDHKTMPYEVRGGVALHASKLWPFVQSMQRLELDSFGCQLHRFHKEIKGSTLVDRKRYRFASQSGRLLPEARRKHCHSFLTKGLEQKPPSRDEFTAYGQACLEMARGTVQLLRDHQGVLFASAIPRSAVKPDKAKTEEFLRKDHVFLLERFFYFLEAQRQYGLLVMDEVEKEEDRKFVRRLEAYFTKTQKGRYRTAWIVPAPFFVSSDMAYPIQAADLCIYCINWGFRLPSQGMDAPTRQEIADEFGPWLSRLQFRGQGHESGEVFDTFGIRFVSNPYAPGA
ncbi:MAG TPA: DUF3800 domain-containing protein [Pirellulales bacterium]|nr:DUF3800 domain-containing protein [Pirellulales bacterium]